MRHVFTQIWKFDVDTCRIINVNGQCGECGKMWREQSRPEIPPYLIQKIEHLAQTTDLSINKIRAEIEDKVSRAAVGQIVKKVRDNQV